MTAFLLQYSILQKKNLSPQQKFNERSQLEALGNNMHNNISYRYEKASMLNNFARK